MISYQLPMEEVGRAPEMLYCKERRKHGEKQAETWFIWAKIEFIYIEEM